MSRRTSGASTTTSRRRRVADDLDGRIAGHERADERLAVGRRPVGRIAEVQGRNGTVGDDVVRDAALETGHRDDLEERQAVDGRLPALVGRDPREALDRAMNGVVGEPRPGRVTADAVEGHLSRQRPDAPRLNRQVGWLEQNREIGLVHEWAAVEERRERVVRRRQLLAPEQEQRNVDGTGLERRQLPYELDGDGDAALHIACTAPVHRSVGDPPRHVVLGGDGVVVPCEDQQRRAGAALARPQLYLVPSEDGNERARHELLEARADLCLVEALGCDVDELERAPGKAVCERAHRAERIAQEGGAYFRR